MTRVQPGGMRLAENVCLGGVLSLRSDLLSFPFCQSYVCCCHRGAAEAEVAHGRHEPSWMLAIAANA